MKYITSSIQRDRRLRREVDRQRKAECGATTEEIIRRVISRPLPRGFYVGVDTAVVMDRRRRSGEDVAKGKRGEMWRDFFAQVDRLLAEDGKMSRVDAICRVIAYGTSNCGFCMDVLTARRILKDWTHCKINNQSQHHETTD